MYDDPNILLERTTAGLKVEVAYLPVMRMVTLTCRKNGESIACTVELPKALDAFEHPMIYLSPKQVEGLGL